MDITTDYSIFFYDEGAVNAKIKRYTCDNCGYNFITDLDEVVEPGCNYTRVFKEKVLEFVGLFFGSVRKIAYKVKKKIQGLIFHIQPLKTGY